MSGLDRRMARTFARDGRSLIVAFDHGLGGANYAGMANPEQTLDEVLAAGADAVLTTIGIARRFERQLQRCGLIVSFDHVGGDPEVAVREAVLLGAEMGKILCFPWNPELPDSIDRVRAWAAVCHAWEFPLMVETIPVSFEATEAHTPEQIGKAARIGCEIGADVLKLHYTGSPETFRAIVDTTYVPAVVLGGPASGDDAATLRAIEGAMAGGAVGIAMGRKIWAHERPGLMVSALAEVIHGGATADQAGRELLAMI